MRRLSLVIIAGLIIGQAAHAQSAAAGGACRADLPALAAEWNALGYPEPAKPAQFRVIGADDHGASGSDIAFMRGQIRAAVRDCDKGDEAAATRRIAAVRQFLHASKRDGN